MDETERSLFHAILAAKDAARMEFPAGLSAAAGITTLKYSDHSEAIRS